MNLYEIVEIESALKQLLVYNLGAKDDIWPGNVSNKDSFSYKLACQDYQGVLNSSKDFVSSLYGETSDILTENIDFILKNASVERYPILYIFKTF